MNFEQQFGSAADESTELEYIWRTKYSLDEDTAIGFEAFGAPGEVKYLPALSEQDHRLGPSFYRDIRLGDMTIELNLIWLIGLTAGSAAHTHTGRSRSNSDGADQGRNSIPSPLGLR